MHYTDEMNRAWQPTPENLLDVAQHAARTLLRSGYTYEDQEDATQVAALELWQALQVRTNRSRAYAFGIARLAITDWLIKRRRKGVLLECSYDALDWLVAQPEQEDDTPRLDIERLRSMSAFSDDELLYLRFCLEGYNRAAIEHEMSVTTDAVYRYRARLLPRLYRLAGQPVPAKRLTRPLSEDEHHQVCQWRAAGLCWPEIGQRLQRHPRAVQSAHRRYQARAAQSST